MKINIEYNGDLLAIIIKDSYSKQGISFFTPEDLSQQLAYMKHPSGTMIKPHVHNPVRREVHYTQEVLIIKRGILRVDFYDDNNGFAIGGDYTKAGDSTANKIRTKDGGKIWRLVAQNQSPGYRSCVQYVPNSNAKQLVAIGFKGIDYSNDAGDSWTHLSDEGFYTIRFLNDSVAYAAGNKRIAKLTFRE